MVCAHQVSLADLCYESEGKSFEGFQAHDLPPRYSAAYLYYGFKKETPREIQSMFDELLIKKKVGPSLGISLPNFDNLPKEERKSHANATDRLKNYNGNKVREAMDKVMEDMTNNEAPLANTKTDTRRATTWDAMFSQSYDPEGSIVKDELFDSLLKSFDDVPDLTDATFSTSIEDWDVDKETRKNVRTRDLLKQQIEESCAAADELGLDGTKAFSHAMSQFQNWCRGERAKRGLCSVTEEEDREGACVPMTDTRFRGSTQRIFNTHKMVDGGRKGKKTK